MYAARLAIIILGMLSGAECPRIAKQIVSPYLQLLERTSMSKIVAVVSMSLDGFVADRTDSVAEVFDWYMNSGDVE